MLREWLSSCLTRVASPAARRLGYAAEMAALAARHRRCRRHWQPHLAATRQILAEQAARHRDPQDRALILGGGLLLDIPWSELTLHFDRLRLADAAFAPATRWLALCHRQRLELQPIDLTGLLPRIGAGLPAGKPSETLPPKLLADVGWIASVNCLSQLPLLPLAWLLRQGSGEAEAEALGRAILVAHLRQMLASGRPGRLIAEAEDHRYDRFGRCLERTDYRPLLEPILHRANARLLREWDWLVHPPGELADGAYEIRRVTAWAFRPTP